MRKLIIPFLVLLCSCQDDYSTKPGKTKTITAAPISPPAENFVFTKPPFEFNYQLMKHRAQELYGAAKNKKGSIAERRFIEFVVDSLLPCWYGTPWDFNGITETPGQGKIACG